MIFDFAVLLLNLCCAQPITVQAIPLEKEIVLFPEKWNHQPDLYLKTLYKEPVSQDWIKDLKQNLPQTTQNSSMISFLKKQLKSLSKLKKKYTKQLKDQPFVSSNCHSTTLKKGEYSKVISHTKTQLFNEGDYTGEITDDFDEEMEASVKQFQARHSLTADGVIGRKTCQALNLSPKDRIALIDKTLSIWNTLDLSTLRIVVSIPLYRMDVFNDHNHILYERVIVGMKSRPTPAMATMMTHIVFNPVWIVPIGMFEKDKKQKIIENPGYLSNHQYTVLDSEGESVNPYNVEWQDISQHYFPYSIRLAPGPTNPLGPIKFHLDNDQAIVMHGYPPHQKQLFYKTERALSSGCIRMEDPIALVGILLTESKEKIEDSLKNIKTKYVELKKRVPVNLVKISVWVEGNKATWGNIDLF